MCCWQEYSPADVQSISSRCPAHRLYSHQNKQHMICSIFYINPYIVHVNSHYLCYDNTHHKMKHPSFFLLCVCHSHDPVYGNDFSTTCVLKGHFCHIENKLQQVRKGHFLQVTLCDTVIPKYRLCATIG